MPIVPTMAPSVTPSTQGVSGVQATATPQDFGSQVGAAVAGVGGAVGDVGVEAAKIATDLNIQQSIRSTKTADAGRVQNQTNLDYTNLPGGPDGNKGFYSLKGQAAVDALPAYNKAIADGEAQTISGFGNDQRAIGMYQAHAQIRTAEAERRAAAYAGNQGDVADLNASTSRIASYNDSLVANYNSPAALQNYQQVVNGEMQTQARLNGWGADQAAEATKIQLSKGYNEAIRASVAAGDIGNAAQMFNKLSPDMDAATRVSLAEHLKPKIMAGAAQSWVNQNLSGQGGVDPQSGGAVATNIADAIHGQESNGSATSPTSIDGAKGGWQITDGTFNQFARPGENINNPKDNEAVGRRIISKYSSDYNGDAGRVATAYFSGPGNVAPAGSPTPYLKDTQDGNGTHVSSYVADVQKRMGNQSQPAMTNAAYSPGDASVVNAASSNNASRVANDTAVHPDYDGLREKAAVAFGSDPEMFTRVNGEITRQQAQYNMGVHTQREAMTKTMGDTAAALADGQNVEIPEVAIRHVFDGPTADAMVLKLQQAQEFGQVYKGVQTMPAADLAAARQKLADGLGTKAAFPVLNGKAINPGASEAETPDFTTKYNTPLSAADEAKYQAWGKEQAAQNGGRNPANDTFDYDMRGFWKAGDGNPAFADNGHAGDAFKKPNHPSFSTLSNYNGADGFQGGTWSGGQDGQPWNFGASPTNVKMQGAEGLKDYFAKVEAGNSLTMPPEQQAPAATPEGYAQRQQELAHFDAAVQRRQKLLTDDPAGYAQSLPAVASAFASAGNDPVKMQAAIALSRSTQAGLGVADSDVRSLPASQVAAAVKTLTTQSVDGKDGVDMGARLDKMQTQYGSQWPGVFHDLVTTGKLDPSYQALAVMDQPSQLGAREDLQRALQLRTKLGADKFDSGVPDTEKVALKQGIDSQMSNFRPTTQFGGGEMMETVVKPAVTSLATYYASQGMPGDRAASMAYDSIIGQKYDISGALRVPKGQMGAVQAAGDQLLSGLTQADLAPSNAPGGADVRAARNGMWATAPDGQSAVLMARKTTGPGYIPVRGADGNYISMNFKNLPTFANAVPQANPGDTAAGP